MLIAQDVHRFMLIADVAIVPTSDVLEKEILDNFREWYGSLGKTVWACGPSTHPEEDAAISVVSEPKPEDEKVLSFLNRVHKTHGDKSVIYVRCSDTSLRLPGRSHSSADIVRHYILA
jgi:hypothetical protein